MNKKGGRGAFSDTNLDDLPNMYASWFDRCKYKAKSGKGASILHSGLETWAPTPIHACAYVTSGLQKRGVIRVSHILPPLQTQFRLFNPIILMNHIAMSHTNIMTILVGLQCSMRILP